MQTESLLKKYFFLNDIKNHLTDNINFSQSPISEVIEKTVNHSYLSVQSNIQLHDYIFKFYAYNEIISSFRNKHNGIISAEDFSILNQYEQFTNDFSQRVFSFILYSCIAEARHCEHIKVDSAEEDFEFYEEMQQEFVKKTISEFEQGKKNKLFMRFLNHLKNEVDNTKYQQTLSKPLVLSTMFNEYLYNYCDIPYDLPLLFQKQFHTLKAEHHITHLRPYVTKMFAAFYNVSTKLIDKNKLQRFNDFWLFLENVSDSENIGDNGSLQRQIISKKMIQQSTIKNVSTQEILEFLSIVFSQGFSKESSFGGIAWLDITEHALAFANGTINAEVFIDQSLSLEHNSGQIFNKNFIFSEDSRLHHLHFLVDDINSLSNNKLSMDLKDFILHLQSSSSVLSLTHIAQLQWTKLVHNVDTKKLKAIHPWLSTTELSLFKDNFIELQKMSKKLVFLPEMTELVKKIDYSIPMLDFNHLLSTAIDKNKAIYYQEKLERSLDINQLFSTIISGNFSTSLYEVQQVKKPSFHLHNLNSGKSTSLSKQLIGGKAHGLTDLIHKGFNVPKAFVFDTNTCLTYLSQPQYFHKAYKTIEEQLHASLVDDNNQPIIVSIRSGAPVSMPGMMDSILNVGIDNTNYDQLCKVYGKAMMSECIISFMTQFCSSKLNLHIKFPKSLHKALDKFAELLIKHDIPCDRKNLFPLSKQAQIKLCVEAVFDSWNCPRAIAWRVEKNISHSLGTAAIVQQMVFGNRNDNSFTCVIFSRDCISGSPNIMGEYLIKSQGEDLVSGKKTPLPISHLQQFNPSIYKQIEYIAKTLEQEQKAIQDLEITVEDGKVYVLQMRDAVVSAKAKLLLANELDLNLLDVISPNNLIGDIKVDTLLQPEFSGLAASPGFMSGILVKNLADIKKFKGLGHELIFFSHQAFPEHVPLMIATQGFITQFGGATSHAAILARSMEKPCIVGIGQHNIKSGEIITIDAHNGKIWKGILPIVINQKESIKLSKKLLLDNHIDIPTTIPQLDASLSSWTNQLSQSIILKKPFHKKNKLFLNIAQKTALLFLTEHRKKYSL